MTGQWIEPAKRDAILDFVRHWSSRAGISCLLLVSWIGIARSKYYSWKRRYGEPNHHNAPVPRSFWLAGWEKAAIVRYAREHPDEGYRRLCYMMLDEDVVAVSPSSVYRVLKAAGLLGRWNSSPSQKGTGFKQPTRPHRHWHVDIAYLNICGTFYYLCSLLDGYSRLIVHWEIRTSMTEAEVETIIQRAREAYPGESPRIISDNGPQFISRDFREFVRVCGMTHVRTSVRYPQSNGKKERWYRTAKSWLRRRTPLSLEDARRLMVDFVRHYNEERLHSAIGYIAPRDKLEGRADEIKAERNRKLADARRRRQAEQRCLPDKTVQAHA